MNTQDKRKQTILTRYGGFRAIGQKAAATNKAKYGKDFYARIGAIGEALGSTGGFHYSKMNGLDTHIEAGRKGGLVVAENYKTRRRQRGINLPRA